MITFIDIFNTNINIYSSVFLLNLMYYILYIFNENTKTLYIIYIVLFFVIYIHLLYLHIS